MTTTSVTPLRWADQFWQDFWHLFLPDFGLFCLALAALVVPIALVWLIVHWQTTRPFSHHPPVTSSTEKKP